MSLTDYENGVAMVKMLRTTELDYLFCTNIIENAYICVHTGHAYIKQPSGVFI
jgi:hypothetical protein